MKVTCPYCHNEIEKYHDESWNNHGCEARRRPAMTNEREIEILAQIFADKRHSSIEWGRECARIVVEAGYRHSDTPEAGKPDRQTISEAIGEASVCWEPIPSGVFLSERANKIVDRICQHFGQPPAVAIKWPEEKYGTATVNGNKYASDYDQGWNDCLDLCQQAVKEAGVREVKYPVKRIVTDSEDTLEEQRIFGRNAAIDEMRKLNEPPEAEREK